MDCISEEGGCSSLADWSTKGIIESFLREGTDPSHFLFKYTSPFVKVVIFLIFVILG